MLNEQSFKPMEELLKKAHQLMKKIREQNQRWRGAGAFEQDVDDATALLQKTEQALWELAAVSVESLSESSEASHYEEIHEALGEECTLISRVFDDIKTAHEAVENGRSQNEAIRQTEIHIGQFASQFKRTRDRLLELARLAKAKSG